MKTQSLRHRIDPTMRLCMAAAATLLAASQAHAASITWGAATTISAATDVLTTGALKYAYTESNSTASVNGVSFSAGSSFTSLGGGNVTLSGTGFTRVDNAFGSPTGMTGDYTKLLTGAASGASTAGTVTLNNITADHEYATQIWVNDSRNGTSGRSETVSSPGGNSVTLSYTDTGTTGGKGQFSIGKFVADATSQAFTMDGTGSTPTQLNAIQLRDISASWSGATSGTWADSDTTSSNFSGLNFTAAKAQSTVAVFGDTTTAGGSVSNFNLTVGAGGASTGTVLFENTTAQSYSIASADSTGITGTTSLKKTGNGNLTITGPNTYNGTTTVASGTLLVSNSTGSGTGLGNVSVSSGATLGGTGTISGAATVAGTLNAGNGGTNKETLAFGSTLGLSGSTIFDISGASTRGTDYDGVDITGALTNGGALTLNFTNTFAGGNYSFDLFSFGSQSGNFASVVLAGSYSGSLSNSGGVWSLNSGGNSWTFTQSTGDLAFTAVPELSNVLIGGLIGAGLLRRRRKN